jgi:hypothetical protein
MVGDLLRQGSQWLEQQRTAHCSSPVTYQRGDTSIPVSATFGRSEAEVDDGSGLRVVTTVADFLIVAAELASLGSPQAGDQILVDESTFEVLPLGSEPCWRWSDPYHQTYRIHAKDISDAMT